MKNCIKKIFVLIYIVISPSFASASLEKGYADVVEKLIPSVVNISSTSVSFFGYYPRKKEALGSGFIINKDGTILTNYHIVHGFKSVTVILHNGIKEKAEIIGADPKTDIALLKIETDEKLTPVKFGNSSSMRIGDIVLAIGNPFGLGNTVTTGIISAKSRVLDANNFVDYIQTDAAINSGNSGGPLFNVKGEVIGVNSAIASPGPVPINTGISFAVPIDTIENVISDLKKYGETKRGSLGIAVRDIDEAIKKKLDLPNKKGAVVIGVKEKSTAEKNGLKAGDTIIKYNGKDVDDVRKLINYIAATPLGEEIKLTIIRDGEEKIIETKLQENTHHNENSAENHTKLNSKHIPPLKIRVLELNEDNKKLYNFNDAITGLFITQIELTSPLAYKNVKAGDIIVKVNNKPISKVPDLMKILEKNETAAFLIKTDYETKLITLLKREKE